MPIESHNAQRLNATPALWGEVPIVCFANDWTGDPTSKHHIMPWFANHTDVLWVESSGMRRPQFSKARDLRRIFNRVRSSAVGMRHEGQRLNVVSPLGIPLPTNGAVTHLNGWIYRRAIRKAATRLRWRVDPLMWVYIPTVEPYLRSLSRRGLVYHCVDRWWEFADYDSEVMRGHHQRLCREAEVVFASSGALLADCEPYSDSAYLIRHGVDWKHFADVVLTPPANPPADIADLSGPIIGFVGLLDKWVDFELIRTIAETFPEATVVLIGRATADVSRLMDVPNIRLLGQKSYADLPAYCASFAVGLIPFLFNELTAAVNPIKFREYLSAGLPTVASALPEIKALGPHPRVHLAKTPSEFTVGVRRFLNVAGDQEARRKAALDMAPESWEGRCVEMTRLIDRHVFNGHPTSL